MLNNMNLTGVAAATLAVTLAIGPTQGAIVAVNDGLFGGSAPGTTVTQSVTVGSAADMLVVMTSAELGGLSGDPMTVTYGGVAMNLAAGNLTNSAIWYLDLSTPGITGTNVVVDIADYGTRNGFAAGWVSINNDAGGGGTIAVHSTGTSAASSNTVGLTTAVQTFNVVNFNGNNATGSITVNSPNPEVIYTDTNIGSARAAAAYVGGVAAGTHNYQWTLTGGTLPGDYRRIDAAAFALVPQISLTSALAPTPIIIGGSATVGATISNTIADSNNADYSIAAGYTAGSGTTGAPSANLTGSVANGTPVAFTTTATPASLGVNTVQFTATSTAASNDPITISSSVTVLDHADAEFVGGASNALTLDFGTIVQNTGSYSLNYQIENVLAAFRAGLDLDIITEASDPAAVFSTDAATFSNLAAGNSSSLFSLFLDSNTPLGLKTGQYTFALSDQDALSGSLGGLTLTLNVSATVVPEPASLALLGLSGLLTGRRRSR